MERGMVVGFRLTPYSPMQIANARIQVQRAAIMQQETSRKPEFYGRKITKSSSERNSGSIITWKLRR